MNARPTRVGLAALLLLLAGAGLTPPVSLASPSEDAVTQFLVFGGSDADLAEAVAVNASGIVYVAGTTRSSDFPVRGAYQPTWMGGDEGFVAALDPHALTFLWATFFGGAGDDRIHALSLGPDGSLVVAGDTDSTDLPVLHPFQPALRGARDGFVARFSPKGELLASTYFGGSGMDSIADVVLGASNKPVFAGTTDSSDLPTRNAFQPIRAGGQDAFLGKLDVAGSNLLYATFLGGSRDDVAHGVAVDASGRPLLAGETQSGDFPLRNAFRTNGTGFLARVNATGAKLLTSTLLEGPTNDVALDEGGNIVVCGWSWPPPPPDMPVAWLAKVDVVMSGLAWRVQEGQGFTSNGGYSFHAVAVNRTGDIFAWLYNTAHGENIDADWIEHVAPTGTIGRWGVLYGRHEARGLAVDAYGQAFAVGENANDAFLAVGRDSR